jgi:hypothetical protein
MKKRKKTPKQEGLDLIMAIREEELKRIIHPSFLVENQRIKNKILKAFQLPEKYLKVTKKGYTKIKP